MFIYDSLKNQQGYKLDEVNAVRTKSFHLSERGQIIVVAKPFTMQEG